MDQKTRKLSTSVRPRRGGADEEACSVKHDGCRRTGKLQKEENKLINKRTVFVETDAAKYFENNLKNLFVGNRLRLFNNYYS